jgi:hypothetical protein
MELAGHIKKSSPGVSAFTRGLCEASLPLEEISLSPDEKEQVIEESADFLSRCISDLPPDLYILFQLGCVLFRSYVLLRYGRFFTSLPQSSRKAAFSDFAYNRFGPFRKLFKVVRVTSLTFFYETGPVKAFLEDASGGGAQ